MNDPQKISIVIPAFDEAEGIEDTLNELLEFIKDRDWEIIVVNDGSADETLKILQKFGRLKVIDHPYNKGYGAALKTGIKSASGDVVILFDGDGQHNPADIPGLLDKIPEYDMAVGERSKNSKQDWLRKPGKWVLGMVANILSEHKIPDLNSGLRAIKRHIILDMLEIFPDGFSFSTTSTIAFFKMGYNVCYVPITARKRVGKSTVRQAKHGPQVLLLILRLISLFSPLRIFLNVSLWLFIVGFIYQVEEIIRRGLHIVNGALLLIISSIIIFLFGLIADQLSGLRLSLLKSKKNKNK
ncbi:MAG: glycosyltransferase family 2 protein [candidate division Zixibacteria bacterium]|nr:glycosyltransferase family 2 protein [candidate division Zixibacteria bacterium]